MGLLILGGASAEYQPGMDAMTCGALARHISLTHDWWRLHYATQAYADFYQHPPLGMRATALVFKWVGAWDLSAKILPHLAALGTVVAVVLFGAGYGGRHGVVLNLRRIILMPFVGSTPSVPILDLGRDVACVGLAFLSKGNPTLALLALIWFVVPRAVGVSCSLFWRTLSVASLITTLAGLILGLWCIQGEGVNYLQHY